MGVRRKAILPTAAVVVTVFGAAMDLQQMAPERAGSTLGDAYDADPVNLSTGLYIRKTVDLVVPDVIPIVFSRHYLSSDNRVSRAFGIGTTHSYDTFLAGNSLTARLITEEGSSVYFRSTNPGSIFATPVLEHWESPTIFFGSKMTLSDGLWRITLSNGAMYSFLMCTSTTKRPQCALIGYRDQFGNTTTLTRNADQALVRIVSPNGRWVRLAHDSSNRVVRAWASTGQSVNYEYDERGRLAAAKAATGLVQTYEYDALDHLVRIHEGDGTEIVNDYDGAGRVVKQVVTYPPSSPDEEAPSPDVFEFAYVESGGRIMVTEVVHPDGARRRVVFSTSGYTTDDTRTRPDGSAVTIAFARDAKTNVVNHVRAVCREADGRETVLQAAVGVGVRADEIGEKLYGQCRMPSLPNTEPVGGRRVTAAAAR